jgi:hypothetical protein
MMIALVLFLVASMMAVVILNAAVTGVKRVHDDGVRQKDSLNVSSAAKLVAECIKGSTVTDIEKDIKTVTTVAPVNDGDSPTTSENTTHDSQYVATGNIGGFLETIVKDLPSKMIPPEYQINISTEDGTPCVFTFTVNPPSGSYDDASDRYKINGYVTASGGEHKVYVTAWMQSQPTPVTITETTKENNDTVTVTTTTVTTVYHWDSVELSTTGGVQ